MRELTSAFKAVSSATVRNQGKGLTYLEIFQAVIRSQASSSAGNCDECV